jgi:hypothetical protein
MRIAEVASLFEAVVSAGYGGTERIVAAVCNKLVRLATSSLCLPPGSLALRQFSTVDQALWHCEPRSRTWAVLGHDAGFGHLIHSHMDYWGLTLAPVARGPVVTTLPGRLDVLELQPLYRRVKDLPLVSISDAQRRPVWWANFVATVDHGIDLQEFTFSPRPDSYLAYLGRISPDSVLITRSKSRRRPGSRSKSRRGSRSVIRRIRASASTRTTREGCQAVVEARPGRFRRRASR